MRATIYVALEADSMPQDQKHARDPTNYQKAEYAGEGYTWEQAQAAALTQVPPGALLLYWINLDH